MFRKLLIVIVLAFCFPMISESNAQTLLKNDKIPNDLIITLKRTGQWEDTTTTIKANGDWTYEGYTGLPRQRTAAILLENEKSVVIEDKSVPKTDYTKIKLEKSRIKSLINEFEKIQFFRFGDNYPIEKESILLPTLSHRPTEIISITINGKKKEVSNYLGSAGIRNEMLSDLAEKIREAIFWNVTEDRIPEDLVITNRVSFGEAGWNQSTIKSDGRVYYKSYSNMPTNPKNPFTLFDKAKKPKLKENLSKQQIKYLISEFEKIGSSNLQNSNLSHKDGCTSESITTHTTRKGISIYIKGKTLSAFYDTTCNAKPDSTADKVEKLVKQIEEMLKDVKVSETKFSENK